MRGPNSLTYCLDSQAVQTHTYAWLLAHTCATNMSLAAAAMAPAAGAGVQRLVTSLTVQGAPSFHVTPQPAERSTTARPYVAVRIGLTTARCHDLAGIRAHVEAWLDAHGAAGLTFPHGPDLTVSDLHRRAITDAATPYRSLRNLGLLRDLDQPSRTTARSR